MGHGVSKIGLEHVPIIIEKIRELRKRRDFEEAFGILHKLAEKGKSSREELVNKYNLIKIVDGQLRRKSGIAGSLAMAILCLFSLERENFGKIWDETSASLLRVLHQETLDPKHPKWTDSESKENLALLLILRLAHDKDVAAHMTSRGIIEVAPAHYTLQSTALAPLIMYRFYRPPLLRNHILLV
jgi:hypothetical protein